MSRLRARSPHPGSVRQLRNPDSIRAPGDEDPDRAAPVSLNGDAPLTCQFTLEDRAVRHSYHHLAGIIRAALVR